jgi:threonine dehydrogenase-like Zn-dependent dehydrogenase
MALDLISKGHIDVESLLSHVFDIEEIGEAFALAHDPHEDEALKVSIKFD